MDVTASPLTAATAGEDVLRFWNRYAAQAHTYQHAIERRELIGRVLHPGGPFQRWNWWVARRGREVVGLAGMERLFLDAQRRDVEIDFLLDPDAGTGTARVLLRRAMAPALAGGRTRVMSWNPDVDFHRAFWSGLGARLAQTIDHAYLRLEDTDPELMRRWDRVPPGYRLHAWRGHCPEGLLDLFCAGRRLINDAPLDDLEYPELEYTPEIVRAGEDLALATGSEPWVLIAESAGGEAAGMTEVLVNTYSPGHSEQSDTAVAAAHRRRGLGRALKGRMWRDLRRDAPQVTGLTTENAITNAAMRAINREMGFVSGPRYAIWQAPAERLLARLG